MAYFKAKFKIVTSVNKNSDKIELKLNNKIYLLDTDNGVDFRCGRLAIISTNLRGDILAVYLLDEDNKPFQTYGDIDVLSEGCVVYDETKDIIKNNAYAVQICIQIFNSLNKSEIEINKNKLFELENNIFYFILNNSFGYKTLKEKICELLLTYSFKEAELNKMIQAVKISPVPRTSLIKKLDLNLEDYPESKLIRWN